MNIAASDEVSRDTEYTQRRRRREEGDILRPRERRRPVKDVEHRAHTAVHKCRRQNNKKGAVCLPRRAHVEPQQCHAHSGNTAPGTVEPPIALCGPTLTIRKFSKTPMTIEKLIAYGSITEEIAQKLELLVRSKYNIFISGGTGSGKTTFLNALSNYIPKDERVITIEDSAELQITGVDNLVSLETRNANASGAGQITIRDLIKSSLRMRPERIVVGEVRGGEALDMLQAMNTGHDGSLSTGHANSTEDMLSRLETMVLQGAAGLPLEAIRQQIASAVDIIIHLSRLRDKSRKTMEITEVVGYENGEIKLNPLYVFREDENSTLEHVSGKLCRTENKMVNDFKLRLAGIRSEI